MHTQEMINKIVKEIRQWQQMYDWKFKSWDIFWQMFYKELKSILIKYCDNKDEPNYEVEDIENLFKSAWFDVIVLDVNNLK